MNKTRSAFNQKCEENGRKSLHTLNTLMKYYINNEKFDEILFREIDKNNLIKIPRNADKNKIYKTSRNLKDYNSLTEINQSRLNKKDKQYLMKKFLERSQ